MSLYLDNAASTIVSQSVLDAMEFYYTKVYANPSSIHQMGRDARKAIDEARYVIAKCVNANPEQIIFTSGGSEANNLVFKGMRKFLSDNKKSVAISAIEHPSVINSAAAISAMGVPVKTIAVDNCGHININTEFSTQEVADLGLLSCMSVNNELGTINDITKLGNWCRANRVFFHTDCVQGTGTIDIDVEEMNIDFLSVSGHKIHAPKGVGFLYARNPQLLQPLIHGGDQEQKLRAGTENVAGIVGLAQAMKDVYKTGLSYTKIKETFIQDIKAHSIKNGMTVHFNGDSDTNHSKVVNLRFDGIDGQTLLLILDSKGIYVSAGSACKANSHSPSHVLKAIGLSDEEAMSSIRVSFSEFTTQEEAQYAAKMICECAAQISKM